MTQEVEYLFSKHEVWNSKPKYHQNRHLPKFPVIANVSFLHGYTSRSSY
jgi:hypothetical protein